MSPHAPDELDAWLTWLRALHLRPSAIRAARARAGSLRAALAAGPPLWHELEIPPDVAAALSCPDAAALARERAWLAQPDRHLVVDGDAAWPPQLAGDDQAPAALFIAGDPWLLWRAQLAIVGARSASAGGLANARAFAQAAVCAGLAVTSGLARGIDAAAHAGTLDAGGVTLAVFGTGIDLVYPRGHEALAARIAAGGALVSEFPPGVRAQDFHFPRRNRVIAGLSLGALVVEAGVRSGSLITARLAAELGREVFALPGSIHHALARGCHKLIRDGARLVETPDEIVAALAPLAAQQGQAIRAALATPRDGGHGGNHAPVMNIGEDAAAASRERRAVLAALGHDPASADEIVARSGLTAAAVSSMLLALELEGAIAAGIDGRIARVDFAAPRGGRAHGVGR